MWTIPQKSPTFGDAPAIALHGAKVLVLHFQSDQTPDDQLQHIRSLISRHAEASLSQDQNYQSLLRGQEEADGLHGRLQRLQGELSAIGKERVALERDAPKDLAKKIIVCDQRHQAVTAELRDIQKQLAILEPLVNKKRATAEKTVAAALHAGALATQSALVQARAEAMAKLAKVADEQLTELAHLQRGLIVAGDKLMVEDSVFPTFLNPAPASNTDDAEAA